MRAISKLASITMVLLFVAGVTYLLGNAPDFAGRASSLPVEYAAAYKKVNGAKVTIVSASKYFEGRMWNYGCVINGNDAVLTMSAARTPFHPESLLAGNTYKLDYYYCIDDPACGRILLVHGKIKPASP